MATENEEKGGSARAVLRKKMKTGGFPKSENVDPLNVEMSPDLPISRPSKIKAKTPLTRRKL